MTVYPRFAEWKRSIEKLQESLQSNPFGIITESFIVNSGREIVINLGKDQTTNFRELYHIHTDNKKVFNEVLEKLSKRVEDFNNYTEGLLTAFGSEQIPNATIARLKGEASTGNSTELVKMAVEQRMRNLYRVIHIPVKYVGMCEVEITLNIESNNTPWNLRVYHTSRLIQLFVGPFWVTEDAEFGMADSRDGITFMSQYEYILAKTKEIGAWLELSNKLGG